MNIGVRIKRALAGVGALFILTNALIVPTANAQTFKDVPTDRWSYEFVEQLVTDGVLTVADYFRPGDNVNRAEIVKMAVEATGVGIIDNLPTTPTFDDVSLNAWYGPYVETAVRLGWVEGYRDASGNLTGKFGPGDNVTRAAATKILVNAFGVPTAPDCAENPFNDVRSTDWFADFVLTAYWNRIVNGYEDVAGNLTGKFGPADPITREQAAKIVAKSGDRDPMSCPVAECEVNEDCDEGFECVEGECEEVFVAECETDDDCDAGEYCSDGVCMAETGMGELEISLNEEEAGGDRDIPFNATRISYLPLLFTANASSASTIAQAEGGVTVYEIFVTRQGLGANGDFDDIWAEDVDGNIVSVTVSFNNEDRARIRFPGGLFVPYGETVEIVIVGAMDQNSLPGNTNKFSILSADDVLSSAAVVIGDFVVSGALFRISNYGVAELQFTPQGVPRTVDVGDLQTEIGRFQLRNTGGTGDRNVIVTRITLKNTGSLDPENLGGIALFVGSTRISEVIEEGASDFFTFYLLEEGVALTPNGNLVAQLDGYQIDDGDSRNFTVKGDILGADGQGNTVTFELDEGDIDIRAYEASTGFGAKIIAAGGGDANNIALQQTTVNAGDLNLARDTNSPDSSNVAPGTDDLLLLKARVTTSTELRIKDMRVHYDIFWGDDPATANDLSSGAIQAVTRFSDVFDNGRIIQMTEEDGVAYSSQLIAATTATGDEGETVGQENLPTGFIAAVCGGAGQVDCVIQLFDQTFNVPASRVETAAAGYMAGSNLFAAKGKLTPIYWLFTVDVQDEPAGVSFTNTTIKARVTNADFLDIDYETSGDAVPAANIKGNAEGSIFTVRSSSLECTRTDGLADGKKIVAGNSSVMFAEFACTNNDSGPITISDINLDFGELATDVSKNNISGVHLEVPETALASNSNYVAVNWVQIGSTEDPSLGTETTIDSIDLDVKSSAQFKFRVMGEVSTAARNGLPLQVNVRTSLTGITAYDNDGDLVPNDNITSAGVVIGTALGEAPVLGAQYDLIASGIVAQNVSGDTPDTAIAVANWTDFEVGRYKLSAIDDNILISKILFVNLSDSWALANGNPAPEKVEGNAIANGRVAKFNLYGPTKDTVASTLLAVTEVKLDEAFNSNGNIEFEFANDKRIYVKDGTNSNVRITADINAISDANQTGFWLQLAWGAINALSESSGDNVVQFQVDDDNAVTGIDEGFICWDLNGDGDFLDAGEAHIAVNDVGDNDGVISTLAAYQRLPAAGALILEDTDNNCVVNGLDQLQRVAGVSQADEFTIRNTKPTLTNESLGTSTLTIAAGLPIYRGKISADANDDVHIKRWTLDMSLSGVGITGGWEVVDVNNATTAIPLVNNPPFVDTDGNLFNDGTDVANATCDPGAVACYTGNFKVQYDFVTAQQITKGTSKTYEFRASLANITADPTDSGTLSVRTSTESKEGNVNYAGEINEDVILGAPLENTDTAAVVMAAANGNLFTWSDESAQGHNETTLDWTNGFNLQFPTTYTSLTQ
jgi:hypothetical protein